MAVNLLFIRNYERKTCTVDKSSGQAVTFFKHGIAVKLFHNIKIKLKVNNKLKT